MKYRSNKRGDFIVLDGRSYAVTRQYYHDVDAVAPELLEQMFENLATRRNGMSILTVGDSKFVVGSYPMNDDGDHTVRLSEVRDDNTGIKFKNKIPFLKGTSHVPMMAIVGGLNEAQINIMTETGSLGSVAQMLQQNISTELEVNSRANNQQGS